MSVINNLLLVGRLISKTELREEEGKPTLDLTIAVQRPYKNQEGIYEKDDITVTLMGMTAERTNELCSPGNMIGINGRLQMNNGELKVMVEKITFLSTKTEKEEK
jgi:single-strand DNA-binding protein